MKKLARVFLSVLLAIILVGLVALPVLAGDADIGAEATDRGYWAPADYTLISKDNPANVSGTITTLEIWPAAELSDCVVGTFYTTNGDTLKCRDSAVIGAVTGGSKQTITEDSEEDPLAITVEAGDFIGMYYTTGAAERDTSGFAGVWMLSGEYIDPGDEATYSVATGDAISLKGLFAEPEPPTVTTQAATDVEDTTATGNGNITAVNNGTCNLRGFVWDLATQGAPGNVAPAESGYANDVAESNGFGTGAFTGSLTGLPTGDTIYVRAYAHNATGYGYGDEINFLTKPAAPTNVAATENQSAKVVVTWTKSTGATGYKVYEGANLLDTLGDVATYDHTTGDAPTITGGSVVATDGTETAHIALSLSGTSVANGSTYTYKVVALNATGDSVDSATDTGYRLANALTYQWNRSAADSDADYSEIGGATASTYEDTAAPAGSIDDAGAVTASDGTHYEHTVLSLAGESVVDGAGRYFTCTLVSTDADNTPQTATANRGYRSVGGITYQWQRSAADSDADYSNIAEAVTDPYNDTDGAVAPDGRYYQCIVGSVDASNTPQTSDDDRGYKAIAPLPGAPTDFALTLTDSTIGVSWAMGTAATTTVIMRQANRYPVDITDGVEAYNGAGTGFDDTGLNAEDNEYYYRAWSHNATGYSTDYTEGTIGGTGMILIAIVILVLGLTVTSFIVKSGMLYAVCVPAWTFFMFYVYNLSWSADNPYLRTAITAFGSLMILIMVAMTAMHYIGNRSSEPTYDEEKAANLRKIYNLTHRKKPWED